MKLSEVLEFMDFKAILENPYDEGVQELRADLINAEDLDPADADEVLVRLEDEQGAYLGDIDRERWGPGEGLAVALVDRLDIYANDYVTEPVREIVAESTLGDEANEAASLKELLKIADDHNIDLRSYGDMARAIVHPETIEDDVSPAT